MRTSDLKMNLELPIGRLDTTKRHLQNHQLPKTLNLSVFLLYFDDDFGYNH